MTARRDDHGSSSLEAALVLPLVMMLIAFAVAAGRIALARNAVSSAAAGAARAASIERGSSAAQRAGHQVAANSLRDLNCTPTTTISGNFNAPAGTPATARATVVCTVRLSDLVFPGLPGSKTFNESHESVIDTFRGRRP